MSPLKLAIPVQTVLWWNPLSKRTTLIFLIFLHAYLIFSLFNSALKSRTNAYGSNAPLWLMKVCLCAPPNQSFPLIFCFLNIWKEAINETNIPYCRMIFAQFPSSLTFQNPLKSISIRVLWFSLPFKTCTMFRQRISMTQISSNFGSIIICI